MLKSELEHIINNPEDRAFRIAFLTKQGRLMQRLVFAPDQEAAKVACQELYCNAIRSHEPWVSIELA